jgi:hypothetical protein
MVSGAVQVAHLEIKDLEKLKITLEAPIHQLSSLYVAVDKAPAYLKWWNGVPEKYFSQEKMKAIWAGYAYEDPFGFH